MRLLLVFCMLASSGFSQAHPSFPMTVKERLRLLLWSEGLKDPLLTKLPPSKQVQLPEELEKPLQKF